MSNAERQAKWRERQAALRNALEDENDELRLMLAKTLAKLEETMMELDLLKEQVRNEGMGQWLAMNGIDTATAAALLCEAGRYVTEEEEQ